MSSGLEAIISGMSLKESELNIVAHNLSNASTHGFKEERIFFENVLSDQENSSETVSAIPEGNKAIDFSPGSIVTTENPLDLAIQGEGFFEVQTANGPLYTRNGNFSVDAQGKLVTASGDSVMGVGGAITMTKKGMPQISTSGEVTVDGDSMGKIKIVGFGDLTKLASVGASLFSASSEAQPTTVANPSVLQGKVESSNTNTMLNLVKLIEIGRQYESYQKVLKTQENMNQQLSSSLGQLI